MALPYTPPERIKTTKRCKFSLPGRKYNCRALGRFLLGDKGYCAPHYDATWKATNPVYGQQHDWHIRKNHLTGEPWPYETCRICCDIRHLAGLAQDPCGGKMPTITLRGA